ncbi:type VI secretion system-associated protein TagF [Massilia sp. PAMC28688]|uniref:type VI secretion system-associated protein TagF n=1 Tax=Massilia sp. PAMC28688 TaxID=2861283 RepID=UPI001C62894B|nr:type VI secretion system-associated protein TagF [Massilia sp. PAMC28688]QYF95740.1 type VI secretion system-associated protein TagF [Massilia sp. PAMC28688]
MSVGFFGKLPSHGDFVARRLPAPMQQRFDAWLQGALLRSREQLGPAWPGMWGASPIWRFALGPAVCGDQAWLGVMMPSADRVGRCFPLVLASALPALPVLADCLGPRDAWFGRLEALALSALEPDFSLDTFDAALLATAGVPVPGHAGPGAALPFSPAVSPIEAGRLPPLAGIAMAGISAWWTDGSAHVGPSLACCHGLPAPAAFTAMLDGQWSARGWRQV